MGDIDHRSSFRLREEGTDDRQSQAPVLERTGSARKADSMHFVVAHGFVPSIFACRAYPLTRHLAWHLHALGQGTPPLPVVNVPLTERMYPTHLLSRHGVKSRIGLLLFHRGLPFDQSCFNLVAPSFILRPHCVYSGPCHIVRVG